MAARSRRIFLYSLIAVAILVLPCGVIYHGDGASRFAQAKSLFFHASITSPPDLAFIDGNPIGLTPLPSGRYISKYGVGMPIIWTIPIALAWAASHIADISQDVAAGFLISFVNPIFTFGTGMVMVAALRRLKISGSAINCTILLWLFATSALAYANSAFSETLCGLLLLLGALCANANRLWPAALGGLAIGFTGLVKPELAPLAVIVPGCAFLAGRRRNAVAMACVSLLVGPFTILGSNHLVYGSIFSFSYGSEASQFVAPWRGLRGFAWSPDKAVLLYNMALIPAIAGWWIGKKSPPVKLLCFLTAAMWCVYVPFYSCWWAWNGGLCFGPRFFVTFIPLTMVGAGLFFERIASDNGGIQRWAIGLVMLIIVLDFPIQWLGIAVHGQEANDIGRIVHQSDLQVEMRLAILKFRRGIFTNEIYSPSDFDPSLPATPLIDFESKKTFIAFRHWPLTAIGLRLRHKA